MAGLREKQKATRTQRILDVAFNLFRTVATRRRGSRTSPSAPNFPSALL
jgi:hypothetical protein